MILLYIRQLGAKHSNFKRLLKRNINFILPLILLVCFFVPVYSTLLFSNSNVLLLTDIFTPQATAKENLDWITSAWHPEYFGRSGNAPLVQVLASLSLTFYNNVSFCQKLIAFTPLFLASFLMFIFLFYTDLVKSTSIKTLISILYGVNFITLHQITATSLMYTYAAMPLIILFSYKIVTCKNNLFVNALGLGFSLTLATMINIQSPIVAALVAGPLIFVLSIRALKENNYSPRIFVYIILTFLAAFIIYLLLTLPVSSFYYSKLFTSGLSGVTSATSSPGSQIVLDTSWYKTTFPNVLSPLLALTSPIPSSFIEYLGFIIPLIITIPFISKNKSRHLIAFALLVPIVFSILIIWLIASSNYFASTLYNNLFFLKAFKEPAKWYYIMAFPLCVLLAFGLDDILKYFSKCSRFSRRNKKLLVLPLILLVSVPILSSNNYLLYNIGDYLSPQTNISGQGGSHEVPLYVPSYMLELGNLFNTLRDEEQFRVLWLPTENNVYSALNIADPSGILYPTENQYINKTLTTTICNISNTTDAGIHLASLSIKYIVILKEYNQTMPIGIWYYGSEAQYIIGNPNELILALKIQKDLELVNETSNYALFKNNAFVPVVSVYLNEPAELNESSNAYLLYSKYNYSVEQLNTEPDNYPTKYIFQVTSEEPMSVVLNQNYADAWQAKIIDENISIVLTHYRAFGWSNGFYINQTGTYTIEILYTEQTTIDYILSFWVVALLGFGGLFVLLFLCPRLKAKKAPLQCL